MAESIDGMLAPRRLETYSGAVDRYIVDEFYNISEDGKKEGLVKDFEGENFELYDLTKSRLTIRSRINSYTNMGQARQVMDGMVYAGESDLAAKKYIKISKKRGNTVKLYKPKMNEIINSNFKTPFTPGTGTYQVYNADNALIEYDKSGKIISFMSRMRGASTSIGVIAYLYTSIYTGETNCRHLENNAKNSDFEEYFIRSL